MPLRVERRQNGKVCCRDLKKCLELEMLEEGLEPSRGFRPFGFSYHYSFRHPCGLWSGLSLADPLPRRIEGEEEPGRQVSTPSWSGRYSPSLARDCHHPYVLRFPRVRLNSRGGFPTPVLKLLQVRCVCRFRHSSMVFTVSTHSTVSKSSASIAQAHLPHQPIRRLISFAHPIDDPLRLRRILQFDG